MTGLTLERHLDWPEVVDLLRHHVGDHVQVIVGDRGPSRLIPTAVVRGVLREVEPDWFDRSGIKPLIPGPEVGPRAAFYVDGGQAPGDLPFVVIIEVLLIEAIELLNTRGVCFAQGHTHITVTPTEEG